MEDKNFIIKFPRYFFLMNSAGRDSNVLQLLLDTEVIVFFENKFFMKIFGDKIKLKLEELGTLEISGDWVSKNNFCGFTKKNLLNPVLKAVWKFQY